MESNYPNHRPLPSISNLLATSSLGAEYRAKEISQIPELSRRTNSTSYSRSMPLALPKRSYFDQHHIVTDSCKDPVGNTETSPRQHFIKGIRKKRHEVTSAAGNIELVEDWRSKFDEDYEKDVSRKLLVRLLRMRHPNHREKANKKQERKSSILGPPTRLEKPARIDLLLSLIPQLKREEVEEALRGMKLIGNKNTHKSQQRMINTVSKFNSDSITGAAKLRGSSVALGTGGTNISTNAFRSTLDTTHSK